MVNTNYDAKAQEIREIKSETFLVKANKTNPQVITCSITDQLVKNVPVPVVFFYRKSFHYDELINALKDVLYDFPIFAGRLTNTNNNLCINCNNKGVAFSVTKDDCKLDQILNELPTINQKRLVDIIDSKKVISNQSTLLTIKLTYFADGGMTLGACWHHSIGDMYTFMCFMKAWSDAVNKEEYVLPLIVRERDEYLKKNLEKNKNTTASVRYLDIKKLLTLWFYMRFFAQDQVYLKFYFSENELKNMKRSFSEAINYNLSKNDVLCAHLFSIVSGLDTYKKERYLSISINYRPRTNLPHNILGNFVSSINILTDYKVDPFRLAQEIRKSVNNYQHSHMDFFSNYEYIEQNGGLKNIDRFIHKALDPIKRTLLIASWVNFGLYDVIFGESKPIFFTLFGDQPFPWLSQVFEGFSKNGLIYSAILPNKLAKKLLQNDNLQKIHKYRDQNEVMPELVTQLEWLL